jgi:hypothetical protein
MRSVAQLKKSCAALASFSQRNGKNAMSPRQLAEVGKFDGRILATVNDYPGMLAALRARAEELRISRETIDQVAGLPSGYSGKILGIKQVRRLNLISLGPVLGALGIKLVMVEDAAALRDFGGRSNKRHENRVRNNVVNIFRNRSEFSAMGKIGGKNSRKYMDKKTASELGRKAIKARWGKPRVVQVRDASEGVV